MASATTQTGPRATIKAYEDKISAQLQDAKVKLAQFEAKAKEMKSQAEVAAVDSLKTAKANIDCKLQDLKKTHATHLTRAKAEIDADVATFKSGIDAFSAKIKTSSPKK
jgi:F0F1-type ATP synthase membrane subunit b/b'